MKVVSTCIYTVHHQGDRFKPESAFLECSIAMGPEGGRVLDASEVPRPSGLLLTRLASGTLSLPDPGPAVSDDMTSVGGRGSRLATRPCKAIPAVGIRRSAEGGSRPATELGTPDVVGVRERNRAQRGVPGLLGTGEASGAGVKRVAQGCPCAIRSRAPIVAVRRATAGTVCRHAIRPGRRTVLGAHTRLPRGLFQSCQSGGATSPCGSPGTRLGRTGPQSRSLSTASAEAIRFDPTKRSNQNRPGIPMASKPPLTSKESLQSVPNAASASTVREGGESPQNRAL